MALKVHLGFTPSPVMLEELHRLLAETPPTTEIALTQGMQPGENADYELLVSGRPTEALLKASPQLRALIIPWAGVPRFQRDLLESCEGLAIHNLHHNAAATAEMAISLLMAAARDVVPLDQAMRRGDWRARYQPSDCLQLEGSNALVLGYGAIGKRVARACKGLGMRVNVLRRRALGADDQSTVEHMHALESFGGDIKTGLAELMPGTHALMICLPATKATDGVIGAEELELLSESSVVINVGRGPIIDEEALYNALRDRRIRAAGIDTWYTYPRTPEEREHTFPSHYPFHELPNCVLSPHRGGHTSRTELDRASHLAELLLAASRGEEMPNRVSLGDGY